MINQTLYDTDFVGWTYQQADLVKNRKFDELDIKNLIEEIESMGKSQADNLESDLRVLMLHLLKIEHQPEKHTRSWDLFVKSSKFQAKKTIYKNPSLKIKLDEIISDAYYSARLEAAQETEIPEETFPEECPYTKQELLGDL
jgi:hypothetical protein